ncbi:Protein kinase domain [Phytophthora infestans]|uniref:Protein kinase domain n=1 Tax=Phytophthora infestans TaxID=4787 RepID=A0A833TAE4_PHYIN|nr:Protein kinase domain [Phytophthora infestans]
MRQTADSLDEQTKAAITRALINSEAGNQVDGLVCWYSMGNEIGRGTFGRVRAATHRLSGTSVAIKSYSCLHGARSCLPVEGRAAKDFGEDALEWRQVRQEVRILSKLRAHPNILRFVEVFETSTRIHVVTELLRGTSLCEVLQRASGQRLSETRAKRVFQQLVAAVEALHSQCVIHRDLKLENVLLNEESGHVTIIDFGFSDFEEPVDPLSLASLDTENRKKQPKKKKNFCGTPVYMAPEVVTSEHYDGRPVDIWSLGVLLYLMLCGKFPFQGANFHQLFQKLRSGAQQLVLPPTLSVAARALLQSILAVDPLKRPIASELRGCLWLQDIETLEFSRKEAASFEAWPGTNEKVCEALTKLYGVQLNLSDINIARAKPRRPRLSAFLELATAESRQHFLELIAESASSDDVQSPQSDESDTDCDESNSHEDVAPSTRHKQQLEKLIGLVKTSLATSD